MSLTTDENDALYEMLLKTASGLMEHVDAIQILASVQQPNGETAMFQVGFGNFYARQGMAHEFINADQAKSLAKEIDSVTWLEDIDDDDDDYLKGADL